MVTRKAQGRLAHDRALALKLLAEAAAPETLALCPRCARPDRDGEVRAAACKALGRLGAPGSQALLTRLGTEAPDEKVRKVAAHALTLLR